MHENQEVEALVTVAKTVNALMCMLSPEGYFVYLNHYWPELLGWTLDELKSRPFTDFIHPDDVEMSLAAASAISEDSQSINIFRNRFKTKSAGYRWIEWRGAPGENGLIIASGQDVTERALSEQQNQSNLQLLEHAGSIGQIGHWSVDFETKEVLWSDQIYVIHGVTREEYSPELESAINFYHPDDIDKVRAHVDTALAGNADWQFNLRIVRPSGEVRHVASKAQISRDSNGNPSHLFGIFQDITDYEAFTAQFKLLSQVAETGTTGVVITDELSRVVWVNKAFVELSGYQLDEIRGSVPGKFLQGEETAQNTVDEIRHNLEKRLNVDVEILNYRKDGSPYWIKLLISPVISNNGELTNFIGFQQDITHKKEQERLLADAQRRDAVNQLASGVCHDFNNILAVILGNIELIELTNTENISAYVMSLRNASERAQSITQRLLKMARTSESSKAVLVDVDSELANICSMLKEAIPSNITLVTNLRAKGYALVNKDDLVDGIINLIINAKYAITHHGQIEVCSEIVGSYDSQEYHIVAIPKQADSYIKLAVSDSGCGIPSASYEEIFRPFYTTRVNDDGTGLGLSLLANFVVREELGLTLKSKVGQGTEICIYLPLKQGLKTNDSDNEFRTEVNLSGVKIVLIDDELGLLEISRDLLRIAGAVTHSFADPQEALQYIQQNSDNVDIVITDHFMPGRIQGSDVVNTIKNLYPHIPTIVLSGNPMDTNLKGIDGKVLSKPIKLEDLKLEISNSIARHQSIL